MKTIVVSVVALGILALSLAFYRSCASGRGLDVDPHARKEIEKAKQR